ncbi:hypothetical protein MMC16_000519 [Acarospora aff. strigata]|nr:hypothetical protein [Acarospora aff. strigata]
MTVGSKFAWVTLLTRPSYLAGVIILADTLHKYRSKYPLIVLVTDTLPEECVKSLEAEGKRTNQLHVRKIEPLLPSGNVTLIAARFEDTWTKLRVFELISFDKIVFLDADMMICRNMDSLFDFTLPGRDWLAANHACVCNLDKDPWAPADWCAENCAYAPMGHPDALTHPTPVTKDARPTYHLLNSGLFIFHPSPTLWHNILRFFHTSPKLKDFLFPDQNFLDEFFHHKWTSVGWQYNALKTMRYWHPDMWRDYEVRVLHYIVDKPWQKRIAHDGIAGHLGRDGVTHRWWWEQYAQWEEERGSGGDSDRETLRVIRKYVAEPLTEEAERVQVLRNKEAGFPVPVPGKPGVLEEGGQPGGPVIRARRPGEKGHGPVVRT